MNDKESVEFLQWALPKLGLRWTGFRRVRRQVRRRISARMAALGLADADAYRAYLTDHAEEWQVLDGLCRVTISRFYRNRGVFAFLFDRVLPALATARGGEPVRIWSVGCASGEEAYTLAIGGALRGLPVEVLGTDVDPHMIERARSARYRASGVRELPGSWRDEAFMRIGDELALHERFRRNVIFRCEDVRAGMPPGPYDLVLCRNLGFTYFDGEGQARLAGELAQRIVAGGALVVGHHEVVQAEALEPWDVRRGVYRRM